MISYAQNREDVVLWRALRNVAVGRYVEVGANHPSHDSVSRSFYDSGWNGITVEPVPHFADLQRAERPRDTLVEAAVSASDLDEITLHVIPDSGLSTTVDAVSDRHQKAGLDHVDLVVPTIRLDTLLADHAWHGHDIHFLLIDVEGAEQDVLESIDLSVWRPWILVVESTAPTSTEPTHQDWEHIVLEQHYEFCLFDGLSRYYVASEKADELRHDLSYSASVWDSYRTVDQVEADREREELLERVVHWRTVALSRWADSISLDIRQKSEIGRLKTQAKRLQAELKGLRASTSWRVTAPLRRATEATKKSDRT